MIRRLAIIAVAFYATWLGMMVVHEAGHVLHARLSGGTVDHVHIPLVGFSQTYYATNPKPQFVAWGGPVWGCVIPVILLALLIPTRRVIRRAAQFFAGFCLIANGAYLGVGWTTGVGDAGDLIRHGAPVWELVTFGAVASATGLFLWHRLGAKNGPVTPEDAGV